MVSREVFPAARRPPTPAAGSPRHQVLWLGLSGYLDGLEEAEAGPIVGPDVVADGRALAQDQVRPDRLPNLDVGEVVLLDRAPRGVLPVPPAGHVGRVEPAVHEA